ncbi:MAG: hypothetical protein H6819_04615 [Phycisphaerales bacterium]|nr:hypothetical protein [Phycisphaerales bacterium]MCB9856483.1 hypothetical protein [Phycisphaerales bacterium]MCB9863964.1 hypothetical protein [Phycisphaerales bacterium]
MSTLRIRATMSVAFVLMAHGVAPAQSNSITPDVDIDQQKLLQGDYTLRKVLESGRHFFTTPFTRADGFGEGHRAADGTWVAGPRQKCIDFHVGTLANKLFGANPTNGQIATLREALALPDLEQSPFIRVSGLDSQNCFECHNAIGSDNLRDTDSKALARKVSATGAAAGFASSAFINPTFPDPVFKFRRNPPSAFGAGYAQQLAEEMTAELLDTKERLLGKAILSPNLFVELPLLAKGISFGMLRVKYLGGIGNIDNMSTIAACDIPNFEFDYDKLDGISCDLVVRPFQWKGIASNTRNFVKDALEFHFGMLAVEKHLDTDPDPDMDGVANEVSIGNVTALTAFTMALRPPMQIIPPGQEDKAARGLALFEGGIENIKKEDSCASCHQPDLQIYDPNATILTPTRLDAKFACDNGGNLTQPRDSTDELPVIRKYNTIRLLLRARRPAGATSARPESEEGFRERYRGALSESQKGAAHSTLAATAPEHYAFDLTTLIANTGDRATPPTFTQPRLPEAADRSIRVPLFSDLKRHNMGRGLIDVDDQQTDVKGVIVEKRFFLTRPLWGVADSGPWLHDGRALTLRDAILAHEWDDADDSYDSEANSAIAAFKGLSPDDQDAIIQFLLTLRLPTDPRYTADNP